MSGTRGYLSWDAPYVPREHGGRFWLAGRWYDFWPETSNPLNATPSDGAVVLTMDDGSHVVQLPYRSSVAPMVSDALAFSSGFLCDSEDDHRHLMRQKSLGNPVLFFPARPAFESFQAPGNFTLLRAQAADFVPGLSPADYPVEIRLDETVNPSAASVTGRAVASGSSGVLSITYYPVYSVIIEALQDSLSDVNNLAKTFTLQEVLGA